MRVSRCLGGICATLLVTLLCGSVYAEVTQQNLTCGKEACVKWWPKVAPPHQWQANADESKEHGVNMFSPDKQDSAARLYTYAIRKSDAPKFRNLDDVIARDKESHGSAVVREGKKVPTQGGLELRAFLYEASGTSDWDRAAYGDDGEFFVIFYLTASTLEDLNKHTYDFDSFVGSYQGKAKSQEQKQSKP
ncbi:MAG: hypothetical protein WBK91_02935 [Alphaproteobacteria bacterium]